MNEQQLNEWGLGLYRELNKKYEEWSQNEYIRKNGFALFYTPLHFQTDLMIIGYNPGAEDDWKKERHQQPPVIHDYFNHESNSDDDYALARKMRYIFSDELEPKLRESVKLNQLFFKSSDIDTWIQKIDESLRVEIEGYCLNKTYEIIQVLQPKMVLTEGYGTFNRLVYSQAASELSVTEHSFKNGGKWKKIMMESKIVESDTTTIGISHPSGSRVSNEVWEEVSKRLKSYLL